MFWEEQTRRLREKKRRDEEAKERERMARIEREKKRREDIRIEVERKYANQRMLDKIAAEAEVIREERAKEEAAKKYHEEAFDAVVQLARDLREKEEVDAEARKKKARGEGAFSMQS